MFFFLYANTELEQMLKEEDKQINIKFKIKKDQDIELNQDTQIEISLVSPTSFFDHYLKAYLGTISIDGEQTIIRNNGEEISQKITTNFLELINHCVIEYVNSMTEARALWIRSKTSSLSPKEQSILTNTLIKSYQYYTLKESIQSQNTTSLDNVQMHEFVKKQHSDIIKCLEGIRNFSSIIDKIGAYPFTFLFRKKCNNPIVQNLEKDIDEISKECEIQLPKNPLSSDDIRSIKLKIENHNRKTQDEIDKIPPPNTSNKLGWKWKLLIISLFLIAIFGLLYKLRSIIQKRIQKLFVRKSVERSPISPIKISSEDLNSKENCKPQAPDPLIIPDYLQELLNKEENDIEPDNDNNISSTQDINNINNTNNKNNNETIETIDKE